MYSVNTIQHVLGWFLYEKGAAISFTLATFVQFVLTLMYSNDFINIGFIKRNIFENVLLIVINVVIIKIAQLFFYFDSSIINFVFYGFISVLVSVVLYIISERTKKFIYN